MKRLLLLFLTLTFSCAERELQLPVTTNNDITEILDVSPVYIFYDEETGEADLNRNNMISTTNWLVNVDKRLTLKQVLPHLQYLQDKRHGDSAHKNENAKSYFTCFNEETKNLSFIEFTDVRFKKDTLFNFVTPKAQIQGDKNEIRKPATEIIIFRGENSYYLNEKKYNNDSITLFINNLNRTHPYIKSIILGFNENIAVQDYITIKTKISEIDSSSISISNDEIIYY